MAFCKLIEHFLGIELTPENVVNLVNGRPAQNVIIKYPFCKYMKDNDKFEKFYVEENDNYLAFKLIFERRISKTHTCLEDPCKIIIDLLPNPTFNPTYDILSNVSFTRCKIPENMYIHVTDGFTLQGIFTNEENAKLAIEYLKRTRNEDKKVSIMSFPIERAPLGLSEGLEWVFLAHIHFSTMIFFESIDDVFKYVKRNKYVWYAIKELLRIPMNTLVYLSGAIAISLDRLNEEISDEDIYKVYRFRQLSRDQLFTEIAKEWRLPDKNSAENSVKFYTHFIEYEVKPLQVCIKNNWPLYEELLNRKN